jgi:hypothetical protein
MIISSYENSFQNFQFEFKGFLISYEQIFLRKHRFHKFKMKEKSAYQQQCITLLCFKIQIPR